MLNIKMGINTIIKKCMLAAHPVGSYYMSSVSTSPVQLFGGGTWERVTDKFLWAAGDSEIGTTGGERNHTLTIDEMPSHDHWTNMCTSHQGGNELCLTPYTNTGTGIWNWKKTSSEGASGSHNNMPPFVGVYCWKRTA